MCTNFTYMNKCCLKDNFPLSRINIVVDLAIGYEMMALLDCFSSYHHIWLHKEDEEKRDLSHASTRTIIYAYARKP
jgi:hypothetical protein